MKIYLVFKIKDMTARRKEFILDRAYTTRYAAENRVEKLHGDYLFNPSEFVKSKIQQTYILEKALHGQFTEKQVKNAIEKSENVETRRYLNLGLDLLNSFKTKEPKIEKAE
jgi:hypothetical protein